jgi:thymidylate synthase
MIKNKYENQYRKILKDCMSNGIYRNDRTKVGSYSLFDQSIKIDISKYFPMLTGRKIFKKIFDTEFDWFINGETNIKRFKDKNINIWDAWADSNGELGPTYGYQLLNYNGKGINQLENVINEIKTNADSRRHIITLWNPEQQSEMALPPCYHNFQFYVENQKLNLAVTQRSGDLFLGIPYDICVFSKLLLYVASRTSLFPQILSLRIIDAHIYKNQLVSIIDYLNQPHYSLPTYNYDGQNLIINNYNFAKVITAPIAI